VQSIRSAIRVTARTMSPRWIRVISTFLTKSVARDVPWKPVRAYDDGAHVFIQMGTGMSTNDAPTLLIGSGGGTQMVNYRVVDGDRYAVDRLFDKATLLSGVGREQDRVTIAYSGGAR
jgi:type IV secretory pathway VirB9-like protein